MVKSNKSILTDNITFLVLSVLSVPMALYFGTIMVLAVVPAIQVIFTVIGSIFILFGALFNLFVELGPFLFIFIIPLGMMLFSGCGGENRK